VGSSPRLLSGRRRRAVIAVLLAVSMFGAAVLMERECRGPATGAEFCFIAIGSAR
jgi:hypothetical protein